MKRRKIIIKYPKNDFTRILNLVTWSRANDLGFRSRRVVYENVISNETLFISIYRNTEPVYHLHLNLQMSGEMERIGMPEILLSYHFPSEKLYIDYYPRLTRQTIKFLKNLLTK